MASLSTIRIDNDLSSGHAAVAFGPAHDKPACGVHVDGRFVVEEFARDYLLYHFFYDAFPYGLVRNIRVVLRRYHDRVDPPRFLVHVFHGDLALSIGP